MNILKINIKLKCKYKHNKINYNNKKINLNNQFNNRHWLYKIMNNLLNSLIII